MIISITVIKFNLDLAITHILLVKNPSSYVYAINVLSLPIINIGKIVSIMNIETTCL